MACLRVCAPLSQIWCVLCLFLFNRDPVSLGAKLQAAHQYMRTALGGCSLQQQQLSSVLILLMQPWTQLPGILICGYAMYVTVGMR